MDPFTIAALVGGAQLGAGLYNTYQNGKASDRTNAANAEANRLNRIQLDQNYNDVQGNYAPYVQQGQWADQQMQDALGSGQLDMGGGNYSDLYADIPDFQYGSGDYATDVQGFLDPSMDYQINRSNDALAQSAVGGGALTSGATMKALQENGMNFAQQDWGNSANRMESDKSNVYNQFLNKFKQQRQNVADRQNQLSGISSRGYDSMVGTNNARVNQGNGAMYLNNQSANIAGTQALTDASRNTSYMDNTMQGLGNAAGMYNKYQNNQQVNNPINQYVNQPQQILTGNLGGNQYVDPAGNPGNQLFNTRN